MRSGPMKTLAMLMLCLLALTTLAACADVYNDIMYPEQRFDPGTQ